MTKGLALPVLSSALLGALCILPLWLKDFSAVELVFGRFLVFGVCVLMILPFRGDSLNPLRSFRHKLCWFRCSVVALTGNVGYYLFLVLSIKSLGGLAGCLLVGVLPMLFWLLQGKHASHDSAVLMLPLLFFAGLVIVLFDNAAVIEDSSYKDQFGQGVLWLLLSGTCWLWAARQQALIVLEYPGIDRSDHFILSGLFSLLVLCLLAPLNVVGEGEWRLFNGVIEGQNWLQFWLGVFVAGFLGTLVARAIWKVHSSLGATALEPLMAAVMVYLVNARWPDSAEWIVLILLVLVVLLYYRFIRRF